MANKAQIEEFISKIGVLIANEAAARGYKYPSAIIGQAIHESGVTSKLATQFHNYWGLKCGGSWKGARVNLKTKEYVNNAYENTNADWRAYESMEEGVKGYFDFIQMARYLPAKRAQSSREYITIIRDAGFATAPRDEYINKVMKYVNDYNLERFDGIRASVPQKPLTVTASSLRIRKGPGIGYAQIGSYKKGQIVVPISTIAQPDGSVWVRTYEGYACKTLQGVNYMI